MERLVNRARARARANRGRLFRDLMKPAPTDRILDLGGGDGSHLGSILTGAPLVVADISAGDLERARRAGYETIALSEDGSIPADSDAFDIVFSNSVIEHVTVPKAALWDYRTTREFYGAAEHSQARFAAELRRVAKSYFVQTPNKWFPVDAHTWLPGVYLLLPRTTQCAFLRWLEHSPWPKSTLPDARLLTEKDMRRLFPDAEIHRERVFGLTKSLIAVKR